REPGLYVFDLTKDTKNKVPKEIQNFQFLVTATGVSLDSPKRELTDTEFKLAMTAMMDLMEQKGCTSVVLKWEGNMDKERIMWMTKELLDRNFAFEFDKSLNDHIQNVKGGSSILSKEYREAARGVDTLAAYGNRFTDAERKLLFERRAISAPRNDEAKQLNHLRQGPLYEAHTNMLLSQPKLGTQSPTQYATGILQDKTGTAREQALQGELKKLDVRIAQLEQGNQTLNAGINAATTVINRIKNPDELADLEKKLTLPADSESKTVGVKTALTSLVSERSLDSLKSLAGAVLGAGRKVFETELQLPFSSASQLAKQSSVEATKLQNASYLANLLDQDWHLYGPQGASGRMQAVLTESKNENKDIGDRLTALHDHLTVKLTSAPDDDKDSLNKQIQEVVKRQQALTTQQTNLTQSENRALGITQQVEGVKGQPGVQDTKNIKEVVMDLYPASSHPPSPAQPNQPPRRPTI
ncbi:MAG TPA: hypothetical protein VGF75_05210, partial [Candidatus Saccharimonadales bacterium]